MLDNIISISTRNDSSTGATRVAPVRELQPAVQEDRAFSRHYKSAQTEVQNQSSQQAESQRPSKPTPSVEESGKNMPSTDAPAQPVVGKNLPPDSRDAVITDDAVIADDAVNKDDGVDEQAPDDATATGVLAGVELSIEVVQEAEAPAVSSIDLSDVDEEALLSVLTEMSPGVEGMPESILDALRNGGFARLRELVLADIERQSNLDPDAEASLEEGAHSVSAEGDAESTALSALLTALEAFAAELELDETTTPTNANDDLSTDTALWSNIADDQRTRLTQWVAKLIGEPSELGGEIEKDAAKSGEPSVLAELLAPTEGSELATMMNTDGDLVAASSPDSTSGEAEDQEAKTPLALNALASSTGEGSGEPGEEGLAAHKPGSESSSLNTANSSNSASANSAASNATNTLVTDEATLVRQPMEAAAVRESVARQDTEALIKQHLERELPVRNSATEVTQRLTERLVMMVSRDIQTATIRLDPPDLGKLDIRITTTNEQVQVQVVTHQPVVRDLLEQHAHRLREMLEQQGFAKVDVNVSDQSQQERERAYREGGSGGPGDQGEDGESVVLADNVRRSVGLVDHYV